MKPLEIVLDFDAKTVSRIEECAGCKETFIISARTKEQFTAIWTEYTIDQTECLFARIYGDRVSPHA